MGFAIFGRGRRRARVDQFFMVTIAPVPYSINFAIRFEQPSCTHRPRVVLSTDFYLAVIAKTFSREWLTHRQSGGAALDRSRSNRLRGQGLYSCGRNTSHGGPVPWFRPGMPLRLLMISTMASFLLDNTRAPRTSLRRSVRSNPCLASPSPRQNDPAQSKRFIKTAREVEADKNPEAFDRAFEKVAWAKRSKAIGESASSSSPPPSGKGRS